MDKTRQWLAVLICQLSILKETSLRRARGKGMGIPLCPSPSAKQKPHPMLRRNFLSLTSTVLVGKAAGVNQYPIIATPANPAILRQFLPLVRTFLKKVLIEGVEDYGKDLVKDWLQGMLSPNKAAKTEAVKFEKETTVNLNFYGDTEVFVGTDKYQQQLFSVIPLIRNRPNTGLSELVTNHSFVPFFNDQAFLGYFNFPEILALTQIMEKCSRNNSAIDNFPQVLRKAFLPRSINLRKQLKTDSKLVNSCIYTTPKGQVHILYATDDALTIEGEVSFFPTTNDKRIPATYKSFKEVMKK